jgi:hypothetical protein
MFSKTAIAGKLTSSNIQKGDLSGAELKLSVIVSAFYS